jgi:hypothetical protein
MARLRRFIVGTWSVVIASCGAGIGIGSIRLPDGGLKAPAGSSGDVLPGWEIARTDATSAYDAVRRYRPRMLARRATPVATDPHAGYPAIYVGRTYLGSVDQLREMPASMLAEVRYLSGSAALHWLGVRHPGGVIIITPRP